MNRRAYGYLLGTLGLAAAGTTIFLYAVSRPLTVDVAQPSEHVAIQVFGLGTVEARITSRIGFEVGAALIELSADHGDRIKHGDVIARLHSAEQEARVAQSRAGISYAEAALGKARATVTKARAVLAQKKQKNQRQQALVATRTVALEVAEEAQMEVDVAAAELALASGDVEVARAALNDATAQHQFESARLDHHVLKAPYDAIVVSRHEELGAVLSAADAVFTLVAPETVWALAYVDEARAGSIRVGQPAQVHLRSLPGQVLAGHVVRIDIESDRVSEERRVYIACDQCPEHFHLGEQTEVFITTAVLDAALLVAATAVEGFTGSTGTVWTLEDGTLHRREVSFGARTLDGRLEVVSGLPPGARVVDTLRKGLREDRAAKAAQDPEA